MYIFVSINYFFVIQVTDDANDVKAKLKRYFFKILHIIVIRQLIEVSDGVKKNVTRE